MKASKIPGAWRGATVACLASGPSLCAEDAELVRGRCRVIVINTTFRMAPWADALYAMDSAWHRQHQQELKDFAGEKFGLHASMAGMGVVPLSAVPGFRGYSHSGAGAISLALLMGAARVVLLGYDGKLGPAGEVHWHGNHPKPLGNGKSMKRWPAGLKLVAEDARRKGVKIINCSRDTAYECFPRAVLSDVLAEEEAVAC